MADVTSPTGSPSKSGGIHTTNVLTWGSGQTVLLKAALVNGKYLLAGAMNIEKKIRIAEINPATGVPTETASTSSLGSVSSLAIASIEGRTFVIGAESTAGLRVYEYANGTLSLVGTLPGNYTEIVVRGNPLPILFVHSIVSLPGRESYIEAWDSNWITRSGGNPAQARRGAKLRHIGASAGFLGGFEARVVGPNAYLYRVSPIGGVSGSMLITTPVDLTALTLDPNQPPIASSTPVNVSAGARQGAERTINYLGDRWDIQDSSASSPNPPASGLQQISWDWNYKTTYSRRTRAGSTCPTEPAARSTRPTSRATRRWAAASRPAPAAGRASAAPPAPTATRCRSSTASGRRRTLLPRRSRSRRRRRSSPGSTPP